MIAVACVNIGMRIDFGGWLGWLTTLHLQRLDKMWYAITDGRKIVRPASARFVGGGV